LSKYNYRQAAPRTYSIALTLLERNPAWAPPPDAGIEAGCAAVIQAWIDSLASSPRNHGVELSLEGHPKTPGASQEVLSYRFFSNYNKHLHLKDVCAELEAAEHGLGEQLLATLAAVNYVVCDIGTPASVLEMAANELWYGATSNEALARELRELSGMDDDDEEYSEDPDDELGGTAIRPDDYIASLGERYAALSGSGAGLWPFKRLRTVARRKDWVGQTASLLVEARQRFKKCANPRTLPGASEYHCGTIEPSFMFWWGDEENDLMSDLYEDMFQSRFQASDDYGDSLVRVALSSQLEVDAALAWIESAIPFLDAIERLRLHLWSHCNEQQR